MTGHVTLATLGFLVGCGTADDLTTDTSSLDATLTDTDVTPTEGMCEAHVGIVPVQDGVVVEESPHDVCRTDQLLFTRDFDTYVADFKAGGRGWYTSYTIQRCSGEHDGLDYDEVSISAMNSIDSGEREYVVFDGATGDPVWFDTFFWAMGSCDWVADDDAPPTCCYGYCCGGVEPTCAIGSGEYTPLVDCVVVDEGYVT